MIKNIVKFPSRMVQSPEDLIECIDEYMELLHNRIEELEYDNRYLEERLETTSRRYF